MFWCLPRALPRQLGWHSCASRSSATTATSPVVVVEKSKNSKKQRQRTRFGASKAKRLPEDIPSFHAFQQQQQVRSLYRHFMRLANSLEQEDNTRRELLQQVRRQFRQDSNTTTTSLSSWDVKRAISEGSRRYKEVSAMLGTMVKTTANRRRGQESANTTRMEAGCDSNKTNHIGAVVWPWQHPNKNAAERSSSPLPKDDFARPRFLPYPKKSGL